MAKYPTQETAELIVSLFNYMNSISYSGVDKEVVKEFEKIEVTRQELFVKNFGDNSPWACKINKQRKLVVVWDKEKAAKLGL